MVEETKDDSVWSLVQVTTQTAPAFQNNKTGEVLNGEQAMLRILEGIEGLKRNLG